MAVKRLERKRDKLLVKINKIYLKSRLVLRDQIQAKNSNNNNEPRINHLVDVFNKVVSC